MAHGFVDGAESQLGEDLASLLGHHHHEVDDVVRVPGELLA